MPERVSSGRGRHGPWLQNQWLRVESRQDDASISVVALAGGFRPTERALACARPVDGEPILPARADYDIQPHADELGEGKRLTLIAPLPRRGVTLRREVVLYDAYPFAVTRFGIENNGSQPIPLAALHPFTTADGRGRLRFDAAPADWRIYRNGWQSWSPTMSFGGADRDVQSRPTVLSPSPPHREPGRFASNDVGVLFDPAAGRSMLAGAVTAHDALTEVCIDAPSRSLDVRCSFDGLPVAPGDAAWSERIAVDITGHPNDQLARYGEALGLAMRARVPATTPAGWCSWYYFFTNVTEDDVIRNLRFLESHRRELPIDTVQIDDGYQAGIGDWLTANDKFPHGMQWLAAEIKRAGYTPGIWLAPFLLASTSRTFAEHPGFVLRDASGAPALAMRNWERDNYALDGSLPEVRDWLTGLFRAVCDGWGYDYVKIDFLFAAAIDAVRRDASYTRAGAYRAALEAVRAGVGEDRFILGCGSLMAPSVGIFDGNRIGPDVAPWWRFLTTQEREQPHPRPRRPEDELSAETAMRNTLTRTWMHGRLWANDPDCLLVRTERTKLTLDETRSLATVIGLSAGMMLSSDDLERLPPERLDIITALLPVLPRAAAPVALLERDMPERVELAVERPFDPLRLCALFNFDDVPRDLALDLPGGRWHIFEFWEAQQHGIHEGRLSLPTVAPHACRLLALRPARDVPQVVGSTAHVGVGMLDITDQAWDDASRQLRIALAPVGRAARRIVVAPAGREFRGATLAGESVTAAADGSAVSIDVTVDTPASLILSFE